jgi:hypothetical protein
VVVVVVESVVAGASVASVLSVVVVSVSVVSAVLVSPPQEAKVKEIAAKANTVIFDKFFIVVLIRF